MATEDNWISLHMALEYNDTKTVAELFKNRHIDPNEKIDGIPLFFRAKIIEMAQVFIDYGTDLQATDKQGNNILFHLIKDGYPSTFVEFYLKQGVDPKKTSSYNEKTFLHEVAKAHWLEYSTRVVLLDAMLDIINTHDTEGKTPLDIALDPMRVLGIMQFIADQQGCMIIGDRVVSKEDKWRDLSLNDSGAKYDALKALAHEKFSIIIHSFRYRSAYTAGELTFPRFSRRIDESDSSDSSDEACVIC